MTRYLLLAEFWYLAEHVTGTINAATLIMASRVELAVDPCACGDRLEHVEHR